MDDNMRIIKFETIIDKIQHNLDDWSIIVTRVCGSPSFVNLSMRKFNIVLGLIYNYNELNDYGKVIMKHSRTYLTDNTPVSEIWREKDKNKGCFSDFKEKLNAAKEFIKLCSKKNENIIESYKFIFWAMFILAVDKKDAEEKLSLICDFARLLNISDNEIMYIFMVIKSVINQKNYEQEFLKEGKLSKVNDNVRNIFSRVLSLCENWEVY